MNLEGELAAKKRSTERGRGWEKGIGVEKLSFIIKTCENINKNKRKNCPICQKLWRI